MGIRPPLRHTAQKPVRWTFRASHLGQYADHREGPWLERDYICKKNFRKEARIESLLKRRGRQPGWVHIISALRLNHVPLSTSENDSLALNDN